MHFAFVLLASLCVMLLIVATTCFCPPKLRWQTNRLREDIQRLAEKHAR